MRSRNTSAGPNPQIPYVQVVTWNDYEEGTAVEDGIDNCYTVNASLSGSQLTWSLAATDSYASTATVHHFNIYFADAAGKPLRRRVKSAGDH